MHMWNEKEERKEVPLTSAAREVANSVRKAFVAP